MRCRNVLLVVAVVVSMVGCERPDTNDWSPDDREEFLLSCTNERDAGVCLCVLEGLEEKYSDPADYFEEEREEQIGDYADAINFCEEEVNG